MTSVQHFNEIEQKGMGAWIYSADSLPDLGQRVVIVDDPQRLDLMEMREVDDDWSGLRFWWTAVPVFSGVMQ